MVEVTRASIDRVPELASLIGRAFADDPNALWSLGPTATPEQVIQWFEAPDRIVAQEGLLWEAGHALGRRCGSHRAPRIAIGITTGSRAA